jgi:hypothetical protein
MKRLYLAILAVSVTSMIAIATFTSELAVTATGSCSASGIAYSAHSPADIYTSSCVPSGTSRTIRISMELKTATAGKYANVFQTGPLNSGIRLEMAKPATLALVTGANSGGGYVANVITTKFQFDRWQTLVIDINSSNRVRAELDGKVVVDSIEPELNYSVSDIAFGSGFSRTRPFLGDIRNASYDVSFFQPIPGRRQTLLIVEVLCFVVSLVAIFCLSGND